MKKSILLAAAIVMFACTLMAGPEKPIGIKQLPQIAQNFIQSYFSTAVFYKGEQEGTEVVEYKIKFTNGVELEFDQKGEWTEVDCNNNKVPNGIIPSPIRNFVVSNYQSNKIVKIERKSYGYEVELNNDIELKFNKEGKFLSAED